MGNAGNGVLGASGEHREDTIEGDNHGTLTEIPTVTDLDRPSRRAASRRRPARVLSGDGDHNSLGGTLGGNVDETLIEVLPGRGWIEKKKTGGTALYWYQRWREPRGQSLGGTLGGKSKMVKRSKYLAPVRLTNGRGKAENYTTTTL